MREVERVPVPVEKSARCWILDIWVSCVYVVLPLLFDSGLEKKGYRKHSSETRQGECEKLPANLG